MTPTCLLSFSGGLDSTAAAIKLRTAGFDVTLGHIEWYVEGMDFGQAQSEAAENIAEELGMPLLTLAHMWFPEQSYAKFSWVPICIATMLHHAGDPCRYPQPIDHRYDAVAFGFSITNQPGHDFQVKQKWVSGMRHTYDGSLLFPVDHLSRRERAALIPPHILEQTVSCYLGESALEPCGKCWKCEGLTDANDNV